MSTLSASCSFVTFIPPLLIVHPWFSSASDIIRSTKNTRQTTTPFASYSTSERIIWVPIDANCTASLAIQLLNCPDQIFWDRISVPQCYGQLRNSFFFSQQWSPHLVIYVQYNMTFNMASLGWVRLIVLALLKFSLLEKYYGQRLFLRCGPYTYLLILL